MCPIDIRPKAVGRAFNELIERARQIKALQDERDRQYEETVAQIARVGAAEAELDKAREYSEKCDNIRIETEKDLANTQAANKRLQAQLTRLRKERAK
jgi:hypothetical protein